MSDDEKKARVLVLTEEQVREYAYAQHQFDECCTDVAPTFPASLTCATCRWWTRYDNHPLLASDNGHCEQMSGGVEDDFGCVEWEAKG